MGLGNPGREYEGTRHNLGFRVALAFAARHGIKMQRETRFSGVIGKETTLEREILVLLPATYMNESGRAVKAVADFFKVRPGDALVVCDDVDLPFGTLLLRPEGGSRGHRGLKSIAACLSTQQFARLQVGVGREAAEGRGLADYVLSRFAKDEEEKLGDVVEQAVDALDKWLLSGGQTHPDMSNKGT